jgi:hypothetical protein
MYLRNFQHFARNTFSMPKAQKHCKLQCVVAFGPHQKTTQIYQKVTLAAAPCLFVLRSPKTWKHNQSQGFLRGRRVGGMNGSQICNAAAT